jgi:Kef-type K+ transport system membrane component KefB
METAAKKTILRIELWHTLLLLSLWVTLGPSKFVDPTALLIGGVFMGINFLLLSFGVAMVLTPLAGKGRVKVGVGLLVLKIVIFLGLLTLLFFRFDLDALSFALGFSTLIVAIVIETLRRTVMLGT